MVMAGLESVEQEIIFRYPPRLRCNGEISDHSSSRLQQGHRYTVSQCGHVQPDGGWQRFDSGLGKGP